MEWNLCNSPPCIPFYPYSMLQNPMPKPSCQKSRKTIITQKAIVTQSSNIVHCYWHTPETYTCTFWSLFKHFFPVQIDVFFFHFLSGGVKQRAKNFTFCWFWLGKKHQNGLSGDIFKVWGMLPKPIVHRFWVYTISGSWKITISGKNFTFCWFWLGKMHWNGLSGAYLGFKACQIQWHLFQVSMISSSWKI